MSLKQHLQKYPACYVLLLFKQLNLEEFTESLSVRHTCFRKCFNSAATERTFVKFTFLSDCCNNAVTILVFLEHNKTIGTLSAFTYVNLSKENKTSIFYNVIIVYKSLSSLIIHHYALIKYPKNNYNSTRQKLIK